MKTALTVLVLSAAVLGATLAGPAGCRRSKSNAVSVMGSTSIQPFAEMLAQEYDRGHPARPAEVQGGGSTAGLQGVSKNIADIGMCSRELKDDEKPLYNRTEIARDGLAVVVNPLNPVKGLKREQIAAIFAGKAGCTNWKAFGGPDQTIHVISREEGSGTREAFQKMVMHDEQVFRKAVTQESNGAVRELVKHDPAAIGYMSLGLVVQDPKLQALAIDGVFPTPQGVVSHEYPLVRPFLFVTRKDKPVDSGEQAFIDFVLSRRGQAILEKEGLVGAPGAIAGAASAAKPTTQTRPTTEGQPSAEQSGLGISPWALGVGCLLAVLAGAAMAVVRFVPGAAAAARRFLRRRGDRVIHVLLTLVALTAISSLALITCFIFNEGMPIINRVGMNSFLLSNDWRPTEGHFGIFPMIVGSLAVTVGAMLIGGLLGMGCAIVLTQFCPPRAVSVIKPSIELLAGIPSVVYGFIGVVILVPFIRESFGGWGLSVLASSIVLGVMMLPTVTSISVDALQAVPRGYREGSIALGATSWQTTCMVMLKAARSGIVAAIILGMGRAVGETMAVIMVAGNTLDIPHSILDPVRTLTSNIALEMGYASDQPVGYSHRNALFATGVTLFVIIMILNTIAMTVSRRRVRKRTVGQ